MHMLGVERDKEQCAYSTSSRLSCNLAIHDNSIKDVLQWLTRLICVERDKDLSTWSAASFSSFTSHTCLVRIFERSCLLINPLLLQFFIVGMLQNITDIFSQLSTLAFRSHMYVTFTFDAVANSLHSGGDGSHIVLFRHDVKIVVQTSRVI